MLSIEQPTTTTTLYKVSTKASPRTVYAHLNDGLLVVARISLGFFVVAALIKEYTTTELLGSSSSLISMVDNTLTSIIAVYPVQLFADSLTRIWRLLILAGMTWLSLQRGYQEETLLVIRGLGVQTSTSSSSYLWTSSARFIPTSSIQDIFIHEAFKSFEVRYYLSIVVEGEEDVVVVFPVSVVACERRPCKDGH